MTSEGASKPQELGRKDGIARLSIDPAAAARGIPAAKALLEKGGLGRGESFMQSAFWARFKAAEGWKAYLCDFGSRRGDDGVFVLVRPLRFGLKFAYIPHAPAEFADIGDTAAGAAILESLARAVTKAIGGSLLFLRYDLAWERDGAAGRSLAESLRRGGEKLRFGSAVQVPDTVILDLGGTEEELLAGMKPKWRYNIRLAEKKGVEVTREGPEALDIFYELYLETAKRDGIAIHPLSYYRELFETAKAMSDQGGPSGQALSVWVARHEGTPIASIITLYYQGHATYLYGASSGEKRNLMPAYALQWRAIQAAAAEGCSDYDFFGIPPDDDPNHPMAGLYFFKTGFGGRIVHRVGCVDYPAMPLAYGLFRNAEALRLVWFKRIKKMLKGANRKG